MVIYKCEKCNYETTRKQNFDRHKNRLTLCGSGKKTQTISSEVYTCTKCQKKFNHKHRFESHINICDGYDKLTCNICNVRFASRQSKYNHYKNVQCVPQNIINQTNNITNTNIETVNNIQNIHINCFGNEDLTYLLDDTNIIQKLKCFGKNGVYGFPKIISDVHFNENKPENNTIIKPDEFGNGVMIKNEDNEWEFREFEDIRESLIQIIVKYFKAYNVVKKKLGIKLIEPKERKILKNFGYELMLLDGNIPKELFDELNMDEEDVDTNIEEIKKRTRKFDKSTMKTLHSKTSSMHWKK